MQRAIWIPPLEINSIANNKCNGRMYQKTSPKPRLLLNSLQKYGITAKNRHWTTAFLSSMTQTMIIIDNAKLTWEPVKSGIPQGSVLSPLLFLKYINSSAQSIFSLILLFADHTKFFREFSVVSKVACYYRVNAS